MGSFYLNSQLLFMSKYKLCFCVLQGAFVLMIYKDNKLKDVLINYRHIKNLDGDNESS